MKGWIKLHRILKEKPIWKQSTPEQKTVLITLLLMANHDEKEWEWQGNKFRVNPGQFVTSLDSIKQEAGKGISIQNVRSSLNRFKKLEFLTWKSTKTGRIITICNWEDYQHMEDTAQQSSQQRPNKEPTTNKNEKNDKNRIKLHSMKFKNFREVVSHFDERFFQEDKWADCYDKLIRIDGYSEDRILEIVKEFREDGNWWKERGNFETLLKLRKKNREGLRYIDYFNTKIKNTSKNGRKKELPTSEEHENDRIQSSN